MFELGRYEYLEDENLALIRHWQGAGRVLDVGCGAGVLGARLREQGNIVWGVDLATDVAESATGRLDRFLQADIADSKHIGELLEGERFDAVVFADVLEHLPDPVGTLRDYLRFLAPDGTVLVSVPNVAIWNVRAQLLLGRFRYTATGTLDRTHLRFFTRANLERALGEAGLRVELIDVNPGIARPFVGSAKRHVRGASSGDRRALLDSRVYRVYRRLVYPIEYRLARLAPGLLAFQYVAIASRAERTP
jgi:2-polyprenyl-3-methyl-5-hydroxy-6-metoxy-1,4-benzoquinol methylase